MEDWSKVLVFGARSEGEQWVIRPSAGNVMAKLIVRNLESKLVDEDQGGRIAVVRSQDGIFLPGGGVEIGETPEEAMRREALEECGFIVLVGQWATRAVQFAYSSSERAHFEKRSTFIECAIEGPDRSRLEDDHELLWTDLRTASRILSHPSHGWAIQQWKQRAHPSSGPIR
jgi:8-oxo-dGTP diphosphatase